MRKDEEIYDQLLQDDYKVNKYKKIGIYAIYAYLPEERRIADGELAVMGKEEDLSRNIEVEYRPACRKLLYIGKSMNMLKRLSSHLAHIQYPYCNESFQHKYNIIRQIDNIEFDVLEYTIPSLLEQKEAYWIGELKPPLNIQIPKPEGKGYTINKKAKTITLEEVLNYEQE